MPRKSGNLTPQERAFAAAMVASGGDKEISARKAEFKHPKIVGNQVAARPAVQAEITRLQAERLACEALPAAVDCVLEILTNKKAPAGARVSAAKLVFDRTMGAQAENLDKQAHELTPEELDAKINQATQQLERLRVEASQRARPVIEAEQSPDASVLD